MSNLTLKILKILKKSDLALYVREICAILNEKPIDGSYCRSVDGNGKRCVWAYRRGDYGKKFKDYVKNLERPDCKHSYLAVLKAIGKLERRRLIKTTLAVLRDELSTLVVTGFVCAI